MTDKGNLYRHAVGFWLCTFAHRWSKWRTETVRVSHVDPARFYRSPTAEGYEQMTTRLATVQVRECSRCGKIQREEV